MYVGEHCHRQSYDCRHRRLGIQHYPYQATILSASEPSEEEPNCNHHFARESLQ